MYTEKAIEFRSKVELASSSMTDKDASTAPELFSGMKYDGSLIKAGTRIRWRNALMKAAVDLWDTENTSPDNAPDLWAELEYVDGVRKIPNDPIPATKQFAKDELGWWEYNIYRSKVNGNVYSPALVPTNWDLVSA